MNEFYYLYASSPEGNVENLISRIPAFQISVPVNCEKWDTKNFIPYVAYIPDNFDEKTFKYIKSYDNKGKIHYLSLEKVPEFPVIVIGSSERVDDNGNIVYNENSLNITDNEKNKTVRRSGMKEYVYKIKFNHLNYVESWVQGGPEVRISVKTAGSQVYGDLWLFARSDVNNRWYYCYNFLFRWYFSDWQKMAFVFYEVDGGRRKLIDISYSYKKNGHTITIKVPVYVGSNDDYITGPVPVDTRDPKYQIYNSSSSIMQWGEAFWY